MQILVVVANNLTRSRMADAEKGSVRTALAHGSVGPERRANAVRLWTSIIITIRYDDAIRYTRDTLLCEELGGYRKKNRRYTRDTLLCEIDTIWCSRF